MISWIQRTFQQHFRTVFLVLLALIVISFVAFTPGLTGGSGAHEKLPDREFFGINLNSPEDTQRMMGDASLSVFLRFGYPSAPNEQVQQYAFQRQAALHLADQAGIPGANETEIADYIKNLRVFAGADGQFDANNYNEFRESVKKNGRGNVGEVRRIISDDIRIERVQRLLAGPGYVLSSDVKKQLESADTSWTLAIATVDYASFKPSITPTETELTKFFEENAARYELAPRVSVSYASFPATDFLGAVTLTENEVKAYYAANPGRFPKPADKPVDSKIPTVTPPTPADPAKDFDAVRMQVELALRIERAARLAAKAASDLSLALYEKKLTRNSPDLAAFLTSQKVTVRDAAPFSVDAIPAELGGSPEVADQALKLNNEHFFSDPISTGAGSLVLFWKDTQPSRQPAFAEVRAKVSSDYVENEKRKRFAEAGRTLQSQLEARLKAGDAFDKAAATVATSNNVKIETKTHPAFTRRQRPQDLDYAVFGALETLKQGQVSNLLVTQDKGFLVYAVEKKTPALSETNPQYASTRTELAQFVAGRAAGEYLNDAISQELSRTAPKEAIAR